MIAIGTALLMLPGASQSGAGLPFLSALFTATSATCVTGLAVVDTGTYFTVFGQTVILVLIQLGGLGFMACSSMLFVLIGKRISLRERLALAESFGEDKLQGVVRLAISAAVLTIICEFTGAALLCVRFIPAFGVKRGIFYAVFHAISAFCNAGFDLLGNFSSFTAYSGDGLVCGVLMALVVTGSLGFAVIFNVFRERSFRRLRLHSKIVLSATAALLMIGAALILFFEYHNPETLGDMPLSQKLLASLFQSVTFRTAGFNTIDQEALRDASKALGCVLMLIGGAPAGTAGGLKITTIVALLYAARREIRGKSSTALFSRRIPEEAVRRSLCIVIIGCLLAVVGTLCVSVMEETGAGGELSFLDQTYEVVSALCTVGLSVGLTRLAGAGTRILLIFLMFAGRVGMLTMALSLTVQDKSSGLCPPEEEILVG